MNELASTTAARIDPALREKIENLINDYANALDDEAIDRWPQFFTESAVYHVTTRENHDAGLPIGIIRCVGRGMMLDRVKAFHTANIFEPHVYNHILGRPSLSIRQSTNIWTSRCNFQVVRVMQEGRSDLYATGKYLDSIVWENGSLRFQERIVVLDSRHVDILMVVPI
jgi:anthranilate 1,2-dioxygenase small subunit